MKDYLTRPALVLLLTLSGAVAHAQEEPPTEKAATRGGFVGVGVGYFTAPLAVSGFADPLVPGGEIDHTFSFLAPVLHVGHRAKYFRVYAEFTNGFTDPETEVGGSSVLTGYAIVTANIDAVIPIGYGGHVFVGGGIGELNFEITVQEPGSKSVIDQTDLVTPLRLGYVHDVSSRLSVEAAGTYIIADEKQDSGRYTVETTSASGGYLGVKYSF